MNDNLKPEDRLRLLRAKTQRLLAQPGANVEATEPTDSNDAMLSAKAAQSAEFQLPDNLLHSDHLSLFLRSLSSRLTSAVDEIRASSDDLDNLTSEVQKIEKLLGRSN